MWAVVGVAARLERADAGAVFFPFVIPEAFVVALVVFPVGVHVAEEGGLAGGGQDGGDVCVGAIRVAVGVVGAVAVVGPEPVDGPGVGGAGGGVVVPELCLSRSCEQWSFGRGVVALKYLQELAARGIETAGVCDRCRVLTARLWIST